MACEATRSLGGSNAVARPCELWSRVFGGVPECIRQMCVCRIYSHDACTARSLIPEESSMVRKEEGMVVLHSDLTEPCHRQEDVP